MLFWNLNRRPLLYLVAQLAAERRVDIVILAECNASVGQLLAALNTGEVAGVFTSPSDPVGRIKLLTRLPTERVTPLSDSRYVSARNINPLLGEEFVLCSVHLPSLLHRRARDLDGMAREVVRNVEEIEDRMGHHRTVFADVAFLLRWG